MGIVKETLYDEGDNVHYKVVVDHSDEINENIDRKKDAAGGFSKSRQFQHIGSVPVHVWHHHAKMVGYYEMDNVKRKEEVIKFLNKFKQWSPVDNIRSQQANESSIIIK